MSPILFLIRSRVRLEIVRIFAKGDNRDEAPILPILLLFRLRAKLERIRRFSKGDNRD